MLSVDDKKYSRFAWFRTWVVLRDFVGISLIIIGIVMGFAGFVGFAMADLSETGLVIVSLAAMIFTLGTLPILAVIEKTLVYLVCNE